MSTRNRYWRVLLAAAMGLVPFLFQDVSAQDSQPTSSGNAVILEEIVVTARKRTENLQDTPIAISAYSEAQLAARGISNLAEITRAAPSLTFDTGTVASGNPAATSIFLRGVGQSDFLMFTEPAVGIYVDGVYIGRSIGSALDFLDVERVEVLRGPQGTLFGRNTIGGVLNLVSKRPGDEPGGSVTLTTGSDRRLQAQASVSLPLSKTVRTKFSAFAHNRDGYVHRVPTDVELGDNDVLAGRLQLEWEPSDRFNVLVSADKTRGRESQTASTANALSGSGFAPDGTPLPVGSPNAVTRLNNSIGGVCATNPDSSRQCMGAAWLSSDPYLENGSYFDPSELDITGSSVIAEWRFENVQIRSITAYRELEAHYGRESDHTPIRFGEQHYDDEQDQLSQELQLIGQNASATWQWVLGAYAFSEDALEHFINVNTGQVTTEADIRLDNTNHAFFGEATWNAMDWLHLTAGARWTSETKKFQTDQVIIDSPNPMQIGVLLIADNTEKTSDYEELTPRFTIAADVASDTMVYGTYSKGFKSGGYNGRYTGVVPPPSAPIPFEPEFVKLYEVGLKHAGLNNRLRLNLALFRNDYEDIQVTFRPDPTSTLSVIGNAAEGRIEGAELDLTMRPVSELQVALGASYLDARYVAVGPTVTGINTSTPFPKTPEFMTNLLMSYDVRLNSGASITPLVDWLHRSEIFHDNIGSPTIRQPAHDVVNANVTYHSSGGNWQLTFGGTNVTDERYITAGLFTGAGGISDVVYARPREWYLSFKWDF